MGDLAPTLGPQVAHFIASNGVHGPGDKIGERFTPSTEELGFLYEAYEQVEDPYRPGRWRRRYRQCIYSRRKGMRKSELMAQVTLAEFDGPVRFSGRWAVGGEVDEWGYVFAAGEPIGERVRSPEIPVVATTEEQAERLVWGVIRYVFLNTPLTSRYKVQQDQIFFVGQPKEAGWIYLIPPTNPEGADGAKPTFTPREEGHLWTSLNLRRTADVMDRNSIKRQAADPWTMDATTTYAPGEGSVLEASTKAMRAGDHSILVDHRQASDRWDLDDDDEWLQAVREASGDAWPWTNVAGIRSIWLNPEKSKAEFRRYQLNQAVAIETKPFSGDLWDLFAAPERNATLVDRCPILLFLDGSLTRDSTMLIGWLLDERPHLFLAGGWEREDASLRQEWRVPKGEVRDLVAELMASHDAFLAGDADRYWSPQMVEWEETYGSDRVIHFPTRHGKLMGNAIDRWMEEWRAGLAAAETGQPTPWTHDASPQLRAHFASTVLGKRGNSPYPILAKASEGLDDKIDGAVAAIAGMALVPDAAVKAADLTAEVGIW